MSEQTIQEGLYSIPVQLDKYICRSLGATTIKDLVKNKEVTGLTIKELEEFHGYISELIDDIKNYQEAIECLK